jgi:hypothetical protein
VSGSHQSLGDCSNRQKTLFSMSTEHTVGIAFMSLAGGRHVENVLLADAGAHKALIPFLVVFATLYASFGMVSPFLPGVVERRGLPATEIGPISPSALEGLRGAAERRTIREAFPFWAMPAWASWAWSHHVEFPLVGTRVPVRRSSIAMLISVCFGLLQV